MFIIFIYTILLSATQNINEHNTNRARALHCLNNYLVDFAHEFNDLKENEILGLQSEELLKYTARYLETYEEKIFNDHCISNQIEYIKLYKISNKKKTQLDPIIDMAISIIKARKYQDSNGKHWDYNKVLHNVCKRCSLLRSLFFTKKCKESKLLYGGENSDRSDYDILSLSGKSPMENMLFKHFYRLNCLQFTQFAYYILIQQSEQILTTEQVKNLKILCNNLRNIFVDKPYVNVSNDNLINRMSQILNSHPNHLDMYLDTLNMIYGVLDAYTLPINVSCEIIETNFNIPGDQHKSLLIIINRERLSLCKKGIYGNIRDLDTLFQPLDLLKKRFYKSLEFDITILVGNKISLEHLECVSTTLQYNLNNVIKNYFIIKKQLDGQSNKFKSVIILSGIENVLSSLCFYMSYPKSEEYATYKSTMGIYNRFINYRNLIIDAIIFYIDKHFNLCKEMINKVGLYNINDLQSVELASRKLKNNDANGNNRNIFESHLKLINHQKTFAKKLLEDYKQNDKILRSFIELYKDLNSQKNKNYQLPVEISDCEYLRLKDCIQLSLMEKYVQDLSDEHKKIRVSIAQLSNLIKTR